MNKWITSDIHLFHKRILEFCPESRPFCEINEMHEFITSDWNERVKPDDEVIIVGDVSFGKLDETVSILKRLHGNKKLVIGNHDEKLITQQAFLDCFVEVHVRLKEKYDKKLVIIDHFPILDWQACRQGSIHLHGHMHGEQTGLLGRVFDVGMDTNMCRVYAWEELLFNLRNREIFVNKC